MWLLQNSIDNYPRCSIKQVMASRSISSGKHIGYGSLEADSYVAKPKERQQEKRALRIRSME